MSAKQRSSDRLFAPESLLRVISSNALTDQKISARPSGADIAFMSTRPSHSPEHACSGMAVYVFE
jgi:hypothetical protein